jgi:hypothetical protein
VFLLCGCGVCCVCGVCGCVVCVGGVVFVWCVFIECLGVCVFVVFVCVCGVWCVCE